jgi:GalNAc-alpha-(1->4)-GalNAc-alpha-(1->3)-diNAcBac-PP-undecaprenol alpha-1,4-N-acetyl-D-galactosaminyltransferase
MRLLFVCRMLANGVGGVERISIHLMNAMVERGHEVSLFTWDRAPAQAFYAMRGEIRWHRLDMGDPARRASLPQRLIRMRRFRTCALTPRPDAIVAFQHGPFLFAALAAIGRGIPVILSERNAPDQFDHARAGRHRELTFLTMRLARAITVQFPGYIECYPAYLHPRIVVLPNPVARVTTRANPEGERTERTLLFVGRLSYEKNLPALLRAFARVSPDHPEWRLRIVGGGREQGSLGQLARELGVQERISLAGTTDDVAAEYRHADLFCLPSRWEGFPNALAEAMAHGLPVVGYRGCAGVNELIVSGRNGLLAEGNGDPDTLAAAIGTLMADAAARERLGTEARRIAETYEPERVFDAWEALFRRATADR